MNFRNFTRNSLLSEPSTVLDNIEQNFSDWSDNDSDDDILNQPELVSIYMIVFMCRDWD